MSKQPREFWICYCDYDSQTWAYDNKESAQKRLQSGLKAPPNAADYKIANVREVSPEYDEAVRGLVDSVETLLYARLGGHALNKFIDGVRDQLEAYKAATRGDDK